MAFTGTARRVRGRCYSMAATGGLGGKDLGGRRATYILAPAEAAAIRLHIAEFPKLLHGVKGFICTLLPPSRRWADDRISICREHARPCHVAGIGRRCPAAAKTRRAAGAAC